MTTESERLGFLREIFFTEGEQTHFDELLKNPKEMSKYCKLLAQDMHRVYKTAIDLINRVENGEFNEAQMEKVEKMIAFYLAVQDNLQLELVKDINYEMER